MDPSLESHCDLGGMYTYSSASKCSSALTRLAKLVSPFEGLPKGSLPRGLLGRRWFLHQDSRRLATNQYEICGLARIPHPLSQSPLHDQYEISGLGGREWRELRLFDLNFCSLLEAQSHLGWLW